MVTAMPTRISEERTVYVAARQCEIRCRLWFEVTELRTGLLRYFLVGIEELD